MIYESHVYVPKGLLAQRAIELLGVSQELIAPTFERLALDDRIRPAMIPLQGRKDAMVAS